MTYAHDENSALVWFLRFLPVICVAILGSTFAHAEPFIEVAGGNTYFHQYKKDGARWYQDAFPWTTDLKSPSWRVGYGDRLNERWFWTLSWLEIGKNSITSQAVGDEEYDAVNHRCLRRCDNPDYLWVNGSGRGPELAFRRQFENLYLRTGGFLWMTKLHAHVEHSFGITEEYYQKNRYVMFAPFVGAGIRYKMKPLELFAEVSYYHGLGSGGYPIAKKATVPMLGMQIQFAN